MKKEEPKTTTVGEVRFGDIRAAIWLNEDSKGDWYTVTFERRYHDGLNCKSCSSFRRDDLLILAKAANEAHSQIFNRERFWED